MQQLGRTLLVIPCWWDKRVDSLAATIRLQRPDVLLEYVNSKGPPISPTPPPGFFHVSNIPDVGELMFACFPPKNPKITNWWMGEKYDGVRGLWNPKIRRLFSRHGNVIRLPNGFTAILPIYFLDGELWFGRRNFSYAMQIVSIKKSKCATQIKWENICYMVFDSPSPFHMEKEFEERYCLLLLVLNKLGKSFLTICARLRCTGLQHMQKYLNSIIYDKGEGIMLRKPRSECVKGKSFSLFKIKNMIDVDASVVEIRKYTLICQLYE